MEWMLMPLKRYADFSGRSRRKEYWMFYLFVILVLAALAALAAVFGAFPSTGEEPSTFGLLFFGLMGIFGLGIIVPSIAVAVRRFHDQDKSGWFYLLGFIPYVGGIIMLVFMCIEGTRGSNRFGADPKDENAPDIFA
jgi:uncharacterized membrane protein YhaH (DUF805 family)